MLRVDPFFDDPFFDPFFNSPGRNGDGGIRTAPQAVQVIGRSKKTR